MPQRLREYSETICLLSGELQEGEESTLTPAQTQAIDLIHRHALRLSVALERIDRIPPHQRGSFIRHELLNLLTPAFGYAELLRDGWIGALTPAQKERVDIIHDRVTAIRNHLIAMNDENTGANASAGASV